MNLSTLNIGDLFRLDLPRDNPLMVRLASTVFRRGKLIKLDGNQQRSLAFECYTLDGRPAVMGDAAVVRVLEAPCS